MGSAGGSSLVGGSAWGAWVVSAGSVEPSPSLVHQLGQLLCRIMTSALRITLRSHGGEIQMLNFSQHDSCINL